MEIIKLLRGRLGSDVMSFSWSLSFVVANLALFAFFLRATNLNIYALPIIGLASFLILGEIPRWRSSIALLAIATLSIYNILYGIILSFILIGIYLVYTLRRMHSTNEHTGMNIGEGISIISHNIAKFSVAALRTLFFNVSYMLFPLLFVWLAIFGAAYWLGYAKLSMGIADFAAVITVLGVIFGLLQYYFSRHEERVQQKLVSHFTSIAFPVEEFSFSEFLEFVTEHDGTYGDVKKEAEGLTNTNYSEIAKFFRETGKEKSVINLALPDFGDLRQFQLLATKFQKSKQTKQKLKEAYKGFFDSKKSEIKKDLESKRAKLNELVWFLFSNINMTEEANVSFLDLNIGKKAGEEESYTDFLMSTQVDILDYVFNIVLGSYKPVNKDHRTAVNKPR